MTLPPKIRRLANGKFFLSAAVADAGKLCLSPGYRCCPTPQYFRLVRCDGTVVDIGGDARYRFAFTGGSFKYAGDCYAGILGPYSTLPAIVITHADVVDESSCVTCEGYYVFRVCGGGAADIGVAAEDAAAFTGPFKYGDACYSGLLAVPDAPSTIVTHADVTDVTSCDDCTPTTYYFAVPCGGGSSTLGVTTPNAAAFSGPFKYAGICYSGLTGPSATVPATIITHEAVADFGTCGECLPDYFYFLPCDLSDIGTLYGVTADEAALFTGPFKYGGICYGGLAGPGTTAPTHLLTHADVANYGTCGECAGQEYYFAVLCSGETSTVAVLPADVFSGAFKYAGNCYSGFAGPSVPVGSPSAIITHADVADKDSCEACDGYYYAVVCGGSPTSTLGVTAANAAAFTGPFSYGDVCYSGLDGPHDTAPDTLITHDDAGVADYDSCDDCAGYYYAVVCGGDVTSSLGVKVADAAAFPTVWKYGDSCYQLSTTLSHTPPTVLLVSSDVTGFDDCGLCTGDEMPCAGGGSCITLHVQIYSSGDVLQCERDLNNDGSCRWVVDDPVVDCGGSDFGIRSVYYDTLAGQWVVDCQGFSGDPDFTLPQVGSGGSPTVIPLGDYGNLADTYAVVSCAFS